MYMYMYMYVYVYTKLYVLYVIYYILLHDSIICELISANLVKEVVHKN